MFIHIAADVLSTCQVLVRNLKGSEFNVLVSETASLGNNFMSRFFKRELAPKKVMGLFVGVPLAGNNNETFCIYTGAFWVRESDIVWVRRELIRPRQGNNEQRHYQRDPVS